MRCPRKQLITASLLPLQTKCWVLPHRSVECQKALWKVCGEGLKAILTRACWAQEPAARPASFAEVLAALRSLQC